MRAKVKTAVATPDPQRCRCGHRPAMHERDGAGACFSKYCPGCKRYQGWAS